ncbi:hypothetical protein [Lysinibacillus piscis]|uniref:Uncharacterized protein n=1 Tax=Lysinibacillus piscis TaxID=2518931 RepID=A0ABQ5NJ53_9BACI|nr:hypothetical protein [Lysinibacillus sp. KH24]GLC88102.1 hypothetical protein LYSBPC_12290 [Lysinibacillus sp. KH24]
MLKQLLEERIANLPYMNLIFQSHIYELQNCKEVLGLEATSIHIQNNKIVAGYMVDQRIFLKSMAYGTTTVSFTNGKHEAVVQLFIKPSGEITVEITPYVGNFDIVPVYFRTILTDTIIAIDLKDALKNYLVRQGIMNQADDIMEVHYQSMHPNVLKNSYAGNFVLGLHPDGRNISNTEEYALANRIANLHFSKIIMQRQGQKIALSNKILLTFMISNKIFVTQELLM